MSLWIPLYESNHVTVKSIIATFFKVFPNGIVWSNDDDSGDGYDAVLFGQAGPTQFDLDEIQARLDRPDYARVKQSLADVGFPTAVNLLATYAGRAAELGEWTRDAQINTDRNLRLQYLSGWSANSFMHGRRDSERDSTAPDISRNPVCRFRGSIAKARSPPAQSGRSRPPFR